MNTLDIETIKYEIGENLSSLWAMRRAWHYWKLFIITTDQYLAMRRGTKKRQALENKARIYYMHYCRMFLTYGVNPVRASLMLSRMNSARLDLGYKLIPISELVDRKYHLSEVF